MPAKTYNVGDAVRYDGHDFTIEIDYGNGVYLIGNADCFVDLVPASHFDK